MIMQTVRPAKSPWQYKVFWIYSSMGFMLIMLGFLIGALILTPLAQDYWGNHNKLERDSAGIDLNADNDLARRASEAGLDTVALGEELLPQLARLQSTMKWLEPLIFVGVASFMVGIALEFSSIPRLLKNRGKVMRVAFQEITRR